MKKFNFLMAVALMAVTPLWYACSDDDTPGSDGDRTPVHVDKQKEKAILLCTFGSTFPEPQKTYQSIINDFETKFPDADVYFSFTSRTCVSRVFASIGKEFVQPDLWLEAIGKAGYKEVYVQSLHVIPGEEYLSLMNTDVKKNFMIKNPNIKVAKGACLLETEEDVNTVAQAIYKHYQEKLDNGEVVVLMGHGNPDDEYGFANQKYSDLETTLQGISGHKNIFVATVDYGKKMFSHIRESLKEITQEKGIQPSELTVNLSPVMSIAGDHAHNDLWGGLENGQTADQVNPNEADQEAEFSWRLKLEKIGYTLSQDEVHVSDEQCNVRGLGDYPEIRNLWIKHLTEAIQSAESWNEHLDIEGE